MSDTEKDMKDVFGSDSESDAKKSDASGDDGSDDNIKNKKEKKKTRNRSDRSDEDSGSDSAGSDSNRGKGSGDDSDGRKGSGEDQGKDSDEDLGLEDGSDEDDLEAIKHGKKKHKKELREVNIELPTFKHKLSKHMFEDIIPEDKNDTREGATLIKVPQAVHFESSGFNPETYEKIPENLLETFDGYVRWRFKNGKKESNARHVKWSDGTYSMVIGNEYYDLPKTKINGDTEHLCVRGSNNLQCLNIFRNKISIRPCGMEGISKMKLIRGRMKTQVHKKKTNMQELPSHIDLEKISRAQLKEEEDRLRQKRKMQAKQKRAELKNKPLDARYLEGEDFSDSEGNLGAIKRKNKQKAQAAKKKARRRDSSDESGSETLNSSDSDGSDRLNKSKRGDISGGDSDSSDLFDFNNTSD